MTETPRDRLWVAALALARTRPSFDLVDLREAADCSSDEGAVARRVLAVMCEYGFLERDSERERWRAGRSVPLADGAPPGFDGEFTYLSAPAGRWTFAPHVVREWVESRLEGRVLNLFAGDTRLRHDGEVVRNDVDEAIPADTRVDAREAAERFAAGSFDTVVLDPPASMRADPALGRVKAAAVELLREDGLAITAGRDSTGMGSTRGFETVGLCLVSHPDGGNDTILVAERRTRDPVEDLIEG